MDGRREFESGQRAGELRRRPLKEASGEQELLGRRPTRRLLWHCCGFGGHRSFWYCVTFSSSTRLNKVRVRIDCSESEQLAARSSQLTATCAGACWGARQSITGLPDFPRLGPSACSARAQSAGAPVGFG